MKSFTSSVLLAKPSRDDELALQDRIDQTPSARVGVADRARCDIPARIAELDCDTRMFRIRFHLPVLTVLTCQVG